MLSNSLASHFLANKSLATKCCTVIFCSILSCTTYATNLTDVYQAAADSDPQIRAAEASMKAQLETYNQSRAGLLPDVRVSANTTWTEREFDNNPREEFNSNGYSARLVQPLIRADRWFNLLSARATNKRALAEYAEAKQALILRVAEAYFNVLRAEDNLTSATAQEKAFKRQLDQIQERFDVGLVAITGVHEAQAAYDLARVTRITQDEARYNSLTALETLTKQRFETVALLDKKIPVSRPEKVSDQWVTIALENNLSLSARRLAVDEAKQALREQKSGHLPTLDAVATYTHSENGGSAFLGNESDVEQYSLELNIPIFQGGATRSRVRQSHHLLNVAKENYENTFRQVKQDILTQHRTVNSDVLRVGAQKLALRSSKSALEATEGGYEVGTRNIVDVLQARDRVFQSERDYANAIYDYILNQLRLKQIAGTLNEQDLLDLNQWLIASTPTAP